MALDDVLLSARASLLALEVPADSVSKVTDSIGSLQRFYMCAIATSDVAYTGPATAPPFGTNPANVGDASCRASSALPSQSCSLDVTRCSPIATNPLGNQS